MIIVKLSVLLLLFGGIFLASTALLPRNNRVTGAAEVILYFVWGLVMLTLLFLLSKLVNLPWYSALIVVGLAAAYSLWQGQYRVQPAGKYQAGELAVVALLSLAAMLPVTIMGYYMAGGEYPGVFYAVDSPFFLHHVHALTHTSAYPPPSYELYPYAFRYHYGVQALVALLSLSSGISPHTLMFAIVVPLLQFLTSMLAYFLVVEAIRGKFARYLAFGILLVAWKHHLLDYLDTGIIRDIVQVERYNFRYAHPPSTMGMLMVLATIYCVLNYREKRLRIIATSLVGLMPMVKIPYMFFAGAGYASALIAAYRRQRDAGLIMHLFVAGAVCVMSYYLLAFRATPRITFTTTSTMTSTSGGTRTGGLLEFTVFGFLDMMSQWQIVTLLVYGTLALAILYFTRQAGANAQVRSLGFFVLGVFVLFSLIELENQNSAQVFDPVIVPAILFLVGIGLGACSGREQQQWYCRAYAGVLLVAMVPGLISLAGHTYILITEPSRGHEYVSNERLGEALSNIPVHDTLIVTNDLRYPAENYQREDRQLQFAGILGHRNLATNFEYRKTALARVPELRERKEKITRLFCGDHWMVEEVAALKHRYGVTHLVIHRHYPHPSDIPLERVYENSDYIVYRF